MTQTDAPRDTGYAPPRWQFDDEVTRVFEDMLRRSIPQLDVMRGLVTDMVEPFAIPNSTVLDLGCSRGESLAPLVDRYRDSLRYVGVEVSPPMLAAVSDRFASERERGVVTIERIDLRESFPDVRARIVLDVLTSLFVPLNYRHRLYEDVYACMVPDSVFVLVTKFLGEGGTINRILNDRYHRFKMEDGGYSRDEVERKRLALEGVQVPLTANQNVEMLRSAGFQHVDAFWRWANFGAFVAIKSRQSR